MVQVPLGARGLVDFRPLMHTPSPHVWSGAFMRVFVAAVFHQLSFAFMINLPGYFSELGASEGQIGLVVAVAGAVSLALRPLLARYLDLVGRKPIILVAAGVNTASLILFLTVSQYGPWMFATRALFTVSEIALFTAFLTYAADTLPFERRTQGLAYFGLAGLVPIGMGSVLAEGILSRWGFSGLLRIAAASVVLSFFVALSLPRRPTDELAIRPRRSLWAALRQRDLVPLWVISFAFAIGVDVLFTYMRTFTNLIGVGSVGLFFGVYAGVAVAIRVGAGALRARFGYRRVLVPTFLALAAAQALLSLTQNTFQFIAAAAIGGLGHGLVFPIVTSEVVRRARTAERGTAMALFISMFDLAVMAAIPVIGRVIDISGYPAAFGTTAVLQIVGLVAFMILDRNATRPSVARMGVSDL